MTQWLIFLVLVPMTVCRLSKDLHWKWKWTILGIAFGLVVSPLSYGLIQMSYIPILGTILGTLGVLGNLIHGSIGYLCLVGCNVIHLHTTVSLAQFTMIQVVSGVVFGYIYGLVGYALDKKRHKEELIVGVLCISSEVS